MMFTADHGCAVSALLCSDLLLQLCSDCACSGTVKCQWLPCHKGTNIAIAAAVRPSRLSDLAENACIDMPSAANNQKT